MRKSRKFFTIFIKTINIIILISFIFNSLPINQVFAEASKNCLSKPLVSSQRQIISSKDIAADKSLENAFKAGDFNDNGFIAKRAVPDLKEFFDSDIRLKDRQGLILECILDKASGLKGGKFVSPAQNDDFVYADASLVWLDWVSFRLLELAGQNQIPRELLFADKDELMEYLDSLWPAPKTIYDRYYWYGNQKWGQDYYRRWVTGMFMQSIQGMARILGDGELPYEQRSDLQQAIDSGIIEEYFTHGPVLDIAPGGDPTIGAIKERYPAADISTLSLTFRETRIAYQDYKVKARRGSIFDSGYSDNAFNFVVAIDSLSFALRDAGILGQDCEAALAKELCRIMKPGAYGLFLFGSIEYPDAFFDALVKEGFEINKYDGAYEPLGRLDLSKKLILIKKPAEALIKSRQIKDSVPEGNIVTDQDTSQNDSKTRWQKYWQFKFNKKGENSSFNKHKDDMFIAWIIEQINTFRTTGVKIKILEVGAGALRLSNFLASRVQDAAITAVDIQNPVAIGVFHHPKVTFVEDSAESLFSIEDNSQDIIILKFVLEHLNSKNNALKAAKRVLKPGGIIIIIAHHPESGILKTSKRLIDFRNDEKTSARVNEIAGLNAEISRILINNVFRDEEDINHFLLNEGLEPLRISIASEEGSGYVYQIVAHLPIDVLPSQPGAFNRTDDLRNYENVGSAI